MNTILPVFILFLSIAAGIAAKPSDAADGKTENSLAVFAPDAVAAPGTLVSDGALVDEAFARRSEAAGKMLLEAGNLVSGKILAEQLRSRTRTSVPLPQANGEHLSDEEIFARASPGVLLVCGLYKCSKCDLVHSKIATGFALSADGIFTTNFHVMDDPDHFGFSIMTLDGRSFPVVEVLAANKAADIAICRATASGLTPLALGLRAPVGRRVVVISHPDGNYYTCTSGIVSRYSRNRPQAPIRMSITADYARGSSGGPLLDECGNAVGMVASTQSIYYTVNKNQQRDLQMVVKDCVPVDVIQKLLAPSKPEKP